MKCLFSSGLGDFFFNPNRSLDFGEIARLCHAACFSPSRRRSGLRRGVARNRMRTEAGKMPESLIFPIGSGHGVSDDRFGFRPSGGDFAGWRGVFQRRIAQLSDVKNANDSECRAGNQSLL